MSVLRQPSRRAVSRTEEQRKLFLALRLGEDRYVLAASDIVVVRPLEKARPVPGAPSWVCGLITHAGQPVPLIDLSARATGRPSRWVTSTRIVLVAYAWPSGATAQPSLLGVMVEQATETIHLNQQSFVPSGVHTPAARYLGPVANTAEGVIQWLRVQDILDDDVRACLDDARVQDLPNADGQTSVAMTTPPELS
ncbi:MAG: purine-binding chemotaxis protein CheW [Comamonadaceae bacterium]|nr:MAG: purine-binding chemotaxis protein CheW [Comamonadaceae bacterium]